MPKAPKGVVVHKDVLFGRMFSGKSQRELADPGLLVEEGQAAAPQAAPIPSAGGAS